MPQPPLERVRKVCLALPEVDEILAYGAPTFRVRGKRFVIFDEDYCGDGRTSVWCKAPFGAQALAIDAKPRFFFSPPYVGRRGWIGIRLDRRAPWSLVERCLMDAYRLAAPKRLVNQVRSSPPPA